MFSFSYLNYPIFIFKQIYATKFRQHILEAFIMFCVTMIKMFLDFCV